MSVLEKFNLGCALMLKRYKSDKWFVPRQLLTTPKASAPVTESQEVADIEKLLKQRFPQAQNIKVTDFSGGCGSMYEIVVVSEEFRGLPLVKQHMLITELLNSRIKNMHGLRIDTKVPDSKQ